MFLISSIVLRNHGLYIKPRQVGKVGGAQTLFTLAPTARFYNSLGHRPRFPIATNTTRAESPIHD